MASKTIACPSCKQWVQTTLYGTQHRCVCGHVSTTRSAAAETQRETSIHGHGDHKRERHSLRRRLGRCFQTKESSSNNSSSTCSSSRNSFKQSYTGIGTGTGTGTPMPLPSSRSEEPVPNGSRPNKRALLCGVTYKQHKYKLKGTYNDVKNMENLLTKTFGFPANCIRILSGNY